MSVVGVTSDGAGRTSRVVVYLLETIENDPIILTKQLGRLRVGLSEGIAHVRASVQRARSPDRARYQRLEREVTDPLAASLLHAIVEELEADLRRERDIGQSCCERMPRS